MRGKQSATFLCASVRRITPADAGKTRLHAATAITSTDHPRGCGENVQQNFGMAGKLGSPPRMRGKLYLPTAV